MAEVSRQEFADLCGFDVKSLNVYISRNKVVVCAGGKKGDTKIDTKEPVNIIFLKARKAKNAQKLEQKILLGRIEPNPNRKYEEAPDDYSNGDDDLPETLSPEVVATITRQSKRGGESDDELGNAAKWMMMKLKGDANLVTVRFEREKILLDKAAAKVLPVDLVMDANRLYARTIFVEFENAIENIASIFCERTGADKVMYTGFMEETRRVLKLSVNKAGKQMDVDIDKLIDTYSDSRQRGERA